MNVEAIIADLTQFMPAGGYNLLANEYEVYVHDIAEAYQILRLHQYVVVVNDNAAGHNIAHVLAHQDELLAATAILAIKSLNFEVARVNDGLECSRNFCAGAQTENRAVSEHTA